MTDEVMIVMYALKKRGCVDNGSDSIDGGVVYKMGWLLNKDKKRYGEYKGFNFKDNVIYDCGDGAWETTPKEVSDNEVMEHVEYYYEETGGDIFRQWGI